MNKTKIYQFKKCRKKINNWKNSKKIFIFTFNTCHWLLFIIFFIFCIKLNIRIENNSEV